MKILIASDLHWPAINGVATFSRNLAMGMAARGHEVLVIAPSQTGRRCKEVDVNHVVVRTSSIPFPFYQMFRISLTPSREVKKIIKDFDPDVIHINMLMWIGQAAMRHGNRLGIPIVSTNHAMPENLMDNLRLLAPVSRPINYVLKEYGARFHSRADYVTLPTQSAIEMFGKTGEKLGSNVEPVSNGVDLKRFKNLPISAQVASKFDIPTGDPIITYIGRLDAEKHLNILLKAFRLMLDNGDKNTYLLIVGSGTELDDLKHKARRLRLSKRIIFTGRVSDEEIVELHRAGTVFCMPSPAELQSIATLEAMASGQPVVAVDAGALRELCQDGRNGYLCKKDDYHGIAEALSKILNNGKLRDQFSQESIKIAKTHDLDYTLERFESIYSDLIKS